MSKPGRRIQLTLRIDGDAVPISAPQPPARGRLDELLPAQREIDNAAIGHAVRKAAAQGQQVSCTKGCSACCRAQPVPVTPPEAHALLRLVEALPPPRRRDMDARFDANVGRLRDAGLADAFLQRPPGFTAAQARDLALRYFTLGLVCPFLVDDACSIHPQRPFVCRQYLVSSDPALCADPFANALDVIPMPLHAATADLAMAEAALGRPQHTVPLVLALEYARVHREELERRFDSEPLFRQWLQALARDGEA